MAKENFTALRVQTYYCTPGKQQSIYWDAKIPGFGLRVTKNGTKAYICEDRIHGKTVRFTIGSPDAWSLEDARNEAMRLRTDIDRGNDPRQLKAEARLAHEANTMKIAAGSVSVADAWSEYLEERRPYWGPRHYEDHLAKSKPGGEKADRGTRGRGTTVAGPLYPLMALKLSDLDQSVVEAWASREGASRPTSARLSWRLLKSFLRWCSEHPVYKLAISENPAKTRRSRELLGIAGVKQDALQKNQLADWFSAVRCLPNSVTSAYLQVLLLIGARPGEVLSLRWEDVDTVWRTIEIRDKVEGTRVIPLTPYVSRLLMDLPRRSEWVFSSSIQTKGKFGRMGNANKALDQACSRAGIRGLTPHGLRRSFATLSEWVQAPVGIVAQIMGHKPSATVEKHYTVRPIDLLALHHEKIEGWILEQAHID
jgi:integrase